MRALKSAEEEEKFSAYRFQSRAETTGAEPRAQSRWGEREIDWESGNAIPGWRRWIRFPWLFPFSSLLFFFLSFLFFCNFPHGRAHHVMNLPLCSKHATAYTASGTTSRRGRPGLFQSELYLGRDLGRKTNPATSMCLLPTIGRFG